MLLACQLLLLLVAQSQDAAWKHLSTKTGDLPVPDSGTQQTSAVVFDVDRSSGTSG